ncbi:MAG: hypothetical protein FWH11_08375 [Micrococcales bacterium]|nr:hypothetical protein [Micrococcales bacterium]
MVVHRRRRVVLAAFVALLVSLGPSHAVTAPDGGDDDQPTLATFGIAPAQATVADPRSFVTIGASPGATINENVAILNQSDFPLPLAVYASEAVNDKKDGSLTLANRDELVDAGTWVTLEVDSVEVPAQSPQTGIGKVIVPFTLHIPDDAEPGDHVAAVVASLTSTGEGADGTPDLELEQRVGLRVYVTVAGPTKPGLTVTDLHTTYDPGPVWGLLGQGRTTVTYTVRNTGNVRLRVEPGTKVAGPFGLLPATADGAPVAELLPRGEVEQTVVVDGVWPLVRSTVTVTAVPGTAPDGAPVTLDPVVVSQGLWTVPWLWLLVLLVVVVVLTRRRLVALGRRVARQVRAGRPPATR